MSTCTERCGYLDATVFSSKKPPPCHANITVALVNKARGHQGNQDLTSGYHECSQPCWDMSLKQWMGRQNCVQAEQRKDKDKQAVIHYWCQVQNMVPPFGHYSCLSAPGRSVIRTAIPSGVQFDFYCLFKWKSAASSSLTRTEKWRD